MITLTIRNCLWAAVSISIALFSANASAQARKPIAVDKARVVEHWTKERRAAAIPRDLVIDERGLGYLRHPDGSLRPYGHDVSAQEAPRAQTASPFAGPGGSGETTPPSITGMDPSSGKTIGSSYTFKATVTDSSGVKSVSFKIRKGSSLAQSFSATRSTGTDTWSVALSGFTDGAWSWWVVAKDNAGKGGNTATSDPVNFTVSTGSSGGGGTGTITSSPWTADGAVQTAAGRIYFEMPSNSKRTRWSGYVCSGTVANDGTADRSIIITAAHCVYDDAYKAFARNVLFIPNQAGTTGTGTDLNCSNDPMGCWAPSFGVVDVNWTTRTFPDNIAWDYAYYVVPDTSAHSGNAASSDALDLAVVPMPVSFASPSVNASGSADFTYALGYSYSEDPKFMYCAEDMTTEGADNWWLASCGLSGGSSGGPWVQDGTNEWVGNTDGSIMSVNSWGYTNQPGMAGPKLSGTSSASCVFERAKARPFPTSPVADGNEGEAVTCP